MMNLNIAGRRTRSLLSIHSRSSTTQYLIRLFSSSSNDNDSKRRLDVAIVGAPNAGKSQLLNQLTQSNVAAVSRKRHTTRDGILGARTLGETQILFVDTPGFLRKKSARQEGLTPDLVVNSALTEMQDVDYTLIVVDAARKLTHDAKETLVNLMLKALYAGGRMESGVSKQAIEQEHDGEKFAIVLNKVDLVKPKRNLLDISDEIGNMAIECIKYREQHESGSDDDKPEQQTEISPELLAEAFPPIFYVSALHNEGVDDIWKHLMNKATPCHEWVLPKGQVTQMSPVERVEEVLREKLYRCLHREVPHHVQQVNRTFQMLGDKGGKDQVLRVDQDLVVRTKSHHKLVVGTGGKTLRRIQQSAKMDLERMFECPVMLHLQVKLNKSKHAQKLTSQVQGARIDFR